MSQDNFWDNRTYAQKLVDESSAIKRRIEPLLKAESQQSDMETMLEMAAAEDEATREDIRKEIEKDLSGFAEGLEAGTGADARRAARPQQLHPFD